MINEREEERERKRGRERCSTLGEKVIFDALDFFFGVTKNRY